MYEPYVLEISDVEIFNDSKAFLQDPDVKLMHNIFIFITMCYIPIILVGNILVFWATFFSPVLMTPNNMLLSSLSVADFIMGPWTIPMYALGYHASTRDYIHFNKYLCLSWFASIEVSGGGSLNHLLFIAIDRYIAVMWPLRYRSIVTTGRVKKFLVCLWTYVLLMAFVPMMGWNNYDYSIPDGLRRCNFYLTLPTFYVIWASFGTISVAIFIPFFLYIHITCVMIRQIKSFEKDYRLMTVEQRQQFYTRVNSIKITATLMFLFIVLWLPYLLIAPLKYFSWFSQVDIEIIKCTTQILTFGNSMVNAPIYAIGRSEYREIYKLMMVTPPWKWRATLRGQYATLLLRSRSHYKPVSEDRKKRTSLPAVKSNGPRSEFSEAQARSRMSGPRMQTSTSTTSIHSQAKPIKELMPYRADKEEIDKLPTEKTEHLGKLSATSWRPSIAVDL